MTRIFIFITYLLFSVSSFSQTKISYSKEKLKGSYKWLDRYVVIDNDTMYGYNSSLSQNEIKYFCDNLNDKKILRLYKDVVYNNLDCGKYEHVNSKQWASEIIVYFDKSIPKKIQKDFKKFFSTIKVENLKINFTRNKEKSNYLIKTTEDIIPDLETIKEKGEAHPYNLVTYNFMGDNNSKFYSGILRINTKLIKDKSLILSKLKQMFFVGLGQFTFDKDVKENSLLSYKYNNSEVLSNEDAALLNLHYLKIQDTPLNCHFFSTFIKDLQSKCKL